MKVLQDLNFTTSPTTTFVITQTETITQKFETQLGLLQNRLTEVGESFV